jgi:regulator of protease activity HflC (stomatin/prohibitin superfamily)
MAGFGGSQILPPFQFFRQELQPSFSFLYPPRLRRGLAAISRLPGSNPRSADRRLGHQGDHVEIKHVDLNENMIRAIAKQAEAERLRRAKAINAMGEQQAAEKLVEAGQLLAREPQAMQLRYFAALHDIASERSSTIVFPLPTDLLTHLAPRSDGAK